MAEHGSNVSWWMIGVAVAAALAPWPIGPEPHLIQKIRWLAASELTRAVDIFDLVLHAAPALLVIGRMALDWRNASRDNSDKSQPSE